MYREPIKNVNVTRNSIIEDQLFSKTCRPSCLSSSYLKHSSCLNMPSPKNMANQQPLNHLQQNYSEILTISNKHFSQTALCENMKSFVNLRQTISEIDYKADNRLVNTIEIENDELPVHNQLSEAFSKKKKSISVLLDLREGQFTKPKGICQDAIEACSSQLLEILLQEALKDFLER